MIIGLYKLEKVYESWRFSSKKNHIVRYTLKLQILKEMMKE